MPDFNVHADAVNVEQIMEQIRARIREKRGVDYTEEQIRELASVKLEKFLDPSGVRSDLVERFKKEQAPYAPPVLPNYAFEEETLFESHRGPLRSVRRLLRPILKLFFNPNPLIQASNIQSKLNTTSALQRIEQDRLAGAGLAGQHRQPPLGRDVELLDKDDVADGKSGQHGARLIARLKGQTRGPAAYRGLSFEKTFEIQDCSLATGACPSVDTSA